MSRHILLAHRVNSEDDMLVVERTLMVLLKGEADTSIFFESEKYSAVRSSALSDQPSESSASFKNLTISVQPSKNRLSKYCTVTVSYANAESEKSSPTNRDSTHQWLSERYRPVKEPEEDEETWYYAL
jgi:hypothetical protein